MTKYNQSLLSLFKLFSISFSPHLSSKGPIASGQCTHMYSPKNVNISFSQNHEYIIEYKIVNTRSVIVQLLWVTNWNSTLVTIISRAFSISGEFQNQNSTRVGKYSRVFELKLCRRTWKEWTNFILSWWVYVNFKEGNREKLSGFTEMLHRRSW